jgi:hypothetical protein
MPATLAPFTSVRGHAGRCATRKIQRSQRCDAAELYGQVTAERGMIVAPQVDRRTTASHSGVDAYPRCQPIVDMLGCEHVGAEVAECGSRSPVQPVGKRLRHAKLKRAKLMRRRRRRSACLLWCLLWSEKENKRNNADRQTSDRQPIIDL